MQRAVRRLLHHVASPPLACAAVTVVALGFFGFGACATTLCLGTCGSVCGSGPVACSDAVCSGCGGLPALAAEPDAAPGEAPVAGAAPMSSIEGTTDSQAY